MTPSIQSIEDLSLDPENANQGTDQGRKVVEQSLSEYGAGRSILADQAGKVIAGNKTLEAAQKLGLPIRVIESDGQELVVVQRTDLDLAAGGKARELAYLDNRASELGLSWDVEQLLKDLNDGIPLEAFFEGDLATILGDQYPEPEILEDAGPQLDKADELRIKWDTELGQLWLLGDHRLICGDSTDPATVGRLMDGEKAALFSTDPPYMVNYTGADRPGSGGKDWSDKYREVEIDGKEEFLLSVFRSWRPYLELNAAWFVWHAGKTLSLFEKCLEEIGVLVHQQIVWVKPVHIMGYSKYSYRHEPCLFGWLEENLPYFRPGWWAVNDTTVWEIDWEGKQRSVGHAHPTQKPVEIFARPMRNHTLPGGICAEPFSGSGSQIIAGEQMGRRVFACELEPAFVAVALERWHEMTGRDPILVDG